MIKLYGNKSIIRRKVFVIKLDITVPVGYTESDIKNGIINRIPAEASELSSLKIVKRALDLKNKGNIQYKMTVAVALSPERESGLLKMKKKVSEYEEPSFIPPESKLKSRPVVVGSGPCGLFAALTLSEAGARPIILERGLRVEERVKKIELFNKMQLLDKECNIQFGEGGAGTFSDGKLKSGSPDKYKTKVLSEFALAGGAEEIMYSASAHLGTDKLLLIVKSLREKIISLGGEFIFSARLTEIKSKNGSVTSVIYEKNGEESEIHTDNIILATGHSARDIFPMLEALGIPMEARPFGIGMRIEHPREYINKLVYGENYPSALDSASYRLVTHLNGGRSVYSFCMCPGGSVVAASSEDGGIVTNGMSPFARNGENSNAAFLVSVTPEDFKSDHPLAGISLQREIEEKAYRLTDSYKAPAITLGDFLGGKAVKGGSYVNPTYPIGVEWISPEEYLPPFVTDSLRAAVSDFDAWMKGFYLPEAVMCGPETRTTSPVKILRDENYESPALSGLYPSGEGAGYAGGIVSSAVDGIKCAEALLKKALD